MGVLDSLWKERLAALEVYYEQVFSILGDTGVILPLVGIGDDGAVNATSFKTRRRTTSGVEATFTWSEAPSAFDTGLDLTAESSWQGDVPIVTFNGTDEKADTLDDPYWSRDDSSSEKMSMGIWMKFPTDSSSSCYLSKWDADGGFREWLWYNQGSSIPAFIIYDESANAQAAGVATTAISTGVWHHIAVTYDGTGGATAANGVKMYLDGVDDTGTPSNNGSYVAMENLATIPRLGYYVSGGNTAFPDGLMAGGPFGPFFVQAELNAAQVKRLYHMGRAALGLT